MSYEVKLGFYTKRASLVNGGDGDTLAYTESYNVFVKEDDRNEQ